MKIEPELKVEHILFADGILSGKTQTQAYIDAGYSSKGARGHASRLVANGNIQCYLRQEKQQVGKVALEKVKSTEIEWLKDQKRILEMAIGDKAVVKYHKVNGEAKSIDVYETNLSAANKAQELIAKRYGWLAKNIEGQQKRTEFNITDSSIILSQE